MVARTEVAARWAARLGVLFALAASLLLGLAPAGWRAGLWHYRVSLQTLMPWAAYLALAAAVLSLVALLAWRWQGRGSRALATIGLIAGAALFAVPWHYNQLRGLIPPIHDVSTDVEDPPVFVALLPVRAAAKANGLERPPEVTRQQQEAYGDVTSLTTTLAPAQAFERALVAARAMPRWRIVAEDTAAGRIEASQASFWMGFIDDVVIRVRAMPQGSRIDIRSVSRIGRSDFGANANRVRAYIAALKAQLG